MRGELRTLVYGLAIVLIVVALFVEPPGTAGTVGYAIVLATMVLLIVRERRAKR